jgi:glycosyltransferase involved in cell wall biosynthesis
VCLKPPGAYAARLDEAGVPVRSLGMGRIPTPATLVRLRAAIEASKPRLVHAFLYAGIQLSRTLKGIGAPFKLISSPRATYRTRSTAELAVDRALKSQDDLLIAEAEASSRYLIDSLGYARDKVDVIRNGVDLESSAFSPEGRAQKRRELGVADGELLLGCVGRLDPQKGQETLLKALAKAPGRLVIVGVGPDREKLERLAADLGLGKRCMFAGEVPDARPWLSAIDLLVHPAVFEGTPNVVMEAMAAGRPVLATNVDGISEVLEDGRTGRLVPPGDADALAAAIYELASNTPARLELGVRAAEQARKFDLDAMIRAYEGAYEKVLR